MAANAYGAFAAFYDRLTGDVDYAGLAAYLRDVFLRHRGSLPATVLDLACGSGSLSLELAAGGAEVIGVDASEDMPNSRIPYWPMRDISHIEILLKHSNVP